MTEKFYYGIELVELGSGSDLDVGDVYVSDYGSPRLLMANAKWSVTAREASELAYRILFDMLGDPQARALHQRFKHRLMPTLTPGKPWQRTHAEILAIVDELRANDALIEQQRRQVDAERPPAEHDGGRGVAGDRITWETDLRGNRTRERGE